MEPKKVEVNFEMIFLVEIIGFILVAVIICLTK